MTVLERMQLEHRGGGVQLARRCLVPTVVALDPWRQLLYTAKQGQMLYDFKRCSQLQLVVAISSKEDPAHG